MTVRGNIDSRLLEYREKWTDSSMYHEKFIPFKNTVQIMEEYYLKQIAEIISKKINKKQLSILDIGCGNGFLTKKLIILLGVVTSYSESKCIVENSIINIEETML